jgi:hypothetical protein
MRTTMRSLLLILSTLVTGSLLAAGHDLSPVSPSLYQYFPVVAGTGSGFIAAWSEFLSTFRTTVASQAVSGKGLSFAGGGASSDAGPVFSMAMAKGRSDSLLVWATDRAVIAKRLSPSGVPLNTTIVHTGSLYEIWTVAAAWNGSRYFVIWMTPSQFFGAFIEADGSSTTPRAFYSRPSSELPVAPEVAWDGQHFIVVFAEKPSIPCFNICAKPDPDRFRVMRLSADGDAIDNYPLVINGTHLRAHIASSGMESLIVLDGHGEVSTIVVHDDQRGLTLDPEVPLAHWFSDTWSAVAWDGTTYMAAWRYVTFDRGEMGAARLTRSGVPFDYRFVSTGTAVDSQEPQPSVAVNDSGVTAFMIAEGTSSYSHDDRARLYLASELTPMPATPPTPRNAVSYFAGREARIDWQSDPAGGFVIESRRGRGVWTFVKVVAGDERTTTVSALIGDQFRVRAFGPAGVSEGTITTIGSMPRRRVAGP